MTLRGPKRGLASHFSQNIRFIIGCTKRNREDMGKCLKESTASVTLSSSHFTFLKFRAVQSLKSKYNFLFSYLKDIFEIFQILYESSLAISREYNIQYLQNREIQKSHLHVQLHVFQQKQSKFVTCLEGQHIK